MSDPFNVDIVARSNLKRVLEEDARAAERSARNIADVYRRNKSFNPGDFEANRRRSDEEARRIQQNQRHQENADTAAKRGARAVGEELTALAGRYLSVGAAIEGARESFMSYAKETEAFRTVQTRAGATDEAMKHLKETLDDVSKQYGVTSEEALQATAKLAGAGYMTLQQAEKLAPAIAKYSRLFGVNMETMATGLGDFMNTLKIEGKDGEEALSTMAFAASKMNVNLEQLNRFAPQLGDTMRNMGSSGIDGLRQTTALLSTLQKKGFGDTRRSAMALVQTLSSLESGSGGLPKQLGMDTEEWGYQMARAAKEGKGLDFIMTKLDQAEREGIPLFKIASNPAEQRAIQALRENYRSIYEDFKNGKMSAEQLAEAIKKMDEGPDAAIRSLTNEFDNLLKAVGELMHELGVTEGIKAVVKDLQDAKKLVEEIQALAKKGLWGAAKDVAGKIHMPTTSGASGLGMSFLESMPFTQPLRYGLSTLSKAGQAAWGMYNGPGGSGGGSTSTLSDAETGSPDGNFDEHWGSLPGRASGGRVSAGSSYVVGERGREIFTAGAGGGMITPMAAASSEKTLEEERHQTSTLDEIRDLLRDMKEDNNKKGGGATGSWGGSGGGGGGGGGGASGSWEGGGGRKHSRGGGGGGGGGGDDTSADDPGGTAPEGPNTNDRLAAQRSTFFNNLDPETKKLVVQAALAEGGERGLQANIEQMVNYGNARGMKNFKQILHSGFYGPVNRGEAQRKSISSRAWAKANAAIEAVRRGSNRIDYRIDQGAPGDPNYALEHQPQYRGKVIDGAFFADHPTIGRGWAARQHAADKAAAAAAAAGAKGNGLDQPALNQRPDMPTSAPMDLQPRSVQGIDMEGLSNRAKGLIKGGKGQTETGVPVTPHMLDPVTIDKSAKDLRSELERPIKMRAELDYGTHTQFARASMRHETNREVREARYNAYADSGAA